MEPVPTVRKKLTEDGTLDRIASHIQNEETKARGRPEQVSGRSSRFDCESRTPRYLRIQPASERYTVIANFALPLSRERTKSPG
jgi:hypothetical protein